jgi:hypothetical protein
MYKICTWIIEHGGIWSQEEKRNPPGGQPGGLGKRGRTQNTERSGAMNLLCAHDMMTTDDQLSGMEVGVKFFSLLGTMAVCYVCVLVY